jgi:hypothetical protein
MLVAWDDFNRELVRAGPVEPWIDDWGTIIPLAGARQRSNRRGALRLDQGRMEQHSFNDERETVGFILELCGRNERSAIGLYRRVVLWMRRVSESCRLKVVLTPWMLP